MDMNTMAGNRGVTSDRVEDGRTTRQMKPGSQPGHHISQDFYMRKKETCILFKPLLFWVFPLQQPNQLFK